MYPSVFGLVVIVVGLVILLRGSPVAMVMFQIVCSLFGGSAALFLPALGGSSIPPAYVALGFAVLRILLPSANLAGSFATAATANRPLLVFVAYGALTAPILPNIFAGLMDIVPMRTGRLIYLYQTFPLQFTPQNVTTAVYLVGTLVSALCAYVAASRYRQAPGAIVKTAVVIAFIHAFLGFTSVIFADTIYSAFLDLFRNGSYAQVDQSVEGISRMKGVSPEPSVFAAVAFAWFVFLFECWALDIKPRQTGAAAAALAAALVFSTSSTAYVSLGVYGVLFLVRRCAIAPTLPVRKLMMLLVVFWILVTLVLLLGALNAPFADRMASIFQSMTIGKADSSSGLQRRFWAQQGIDAFFLSYGLGIGAGSFRSSSIFTSILGSVGIVGTVSFLVYLVQVIKPLNAASYSVPSDDRSRVGIAASWTALMMLIPAGIGSPTPDPGADFAMFCGLALALRRPFAVAAPAERLRESSGSADFMKAKAM